MSPATELAAWHAGRAIEIHESLRALRWPTKTDKWRNMHVKAALLVIAYAGGRRVRDEARQLLRGMK